MFSSSSSSLVTHPSIYLDSLTNYSGSPRTNHTRSQTLSSLEKVPQKNSPSTFDLLFFPSSLNGSDHRYAWLDLS
ncbi:hypothetical protein Bca101_052657 [Brassica carinata]